MGRGPELVQQPRVPPGHPAHGQRLGETMSVCPTEPIRRLSGVPLTVYLYAGLCSVPRLRSLLLDWSDR